MKEIEAAFSKYFSHWGIRLPAEAIEGKQRGKIIKQGWAIWYVFGSDEKGWYLDYYAAHRMTDDRHVRIRADGSCESLETLSSMRLCSEDPKQDAQWEAEFVSTNRRIAEMLEEKGFGLEGDEPGAVQMNRYMLCRREDDDDSLKKQSESSKNVFSGARCVQKHKRTQDPRAGTFRIRGA